MSPILPVPARSRRSVSGRYPPFAPVPGNLGELVLRAVIEFSRWSLNALRPARSRHSVSGHSGSIRGGPKNGAFRDDGIKRFAAFLDVLDKNIDVRHCFFERSKYPLAASRRQAGAKWRRKPLKRPNSRTDLAGPPGPLRSPRPGPSCRCASRSRRGFSRAR